MSDLRCDVLVVGAGPAGSAAVLALSRGRYTRHDGVLSARRAYTLPELDELASAAGLAPAWRTWGAWPRVTTVYR